MNESSGFSRLGLNKNILDTLSFNKFHVPTPIQEKSIPVGLEGKDMIGIAQTGTGKTLAFALPIIQKLKVPGQKGLILLPTRELAVQVEETFKKVAWPLGFRSAVLIGGVPVGRQLSELRKNPDVIIGTPGRIVDLLQQKALHLNRVRILVLDEADRMLDMGFAPQVNTILREVPRERQTMLFSATMPKEIVALATKQMKLPIRVEVAPPGTASKQVDQEIFIVRQTQKMALLEYVLQNFRRTVLVFCRTKYGAKKICRVLNRDGHSAAEIHSNRSFNQRQEALKGFKTGKYRVLVATDIASRGIDVKEIGLVLNFDVPEQVEDYVHRIGRTGRADHRGAAITFVTPDQNDKIRAIEKLMKKSLKVAKLPDLPEPAPKPAQTNATPRKKHVSGHPSGAKRRSFRRRRK